MVALGGTFGLVCFLRCRGLVDTNVLLLHQGCTVLFCVGPIAGCSAVLAVGRYCVFGSLVCDSVLCAKEAQVQEQKKGKKEGKERKETLHGSVLNKWCPVGN